MSTPLPRHLLRLLMAASLLGSTPGVRAQIWNNTDTDFNDPASWTGGLPTSGSAATFNTAPVEQPDVTAPITIRNFTFSDTANGYNLTGSGGAITTNSTGNVAGQRAFTSTITSGSNSIAGPLILGGSGSTAFAEVATGGTLNLSGDISGSKGLNFNTGGGHLVLSGNNSFTGGVTHTASSFATLSVNSATALGTGTFTLGNYNSPFLDNTSGSALALTTNNSITFTHNLTFVGTNSLDMGTGSVSIGNFTLTVQNSRLTLGGDVTMGSSLIKAGSGTLALGGNNSANTAVFRTRGGVLLAQNANALSSGTLYLANGSVLGIGYDAAFTRALGTGANQVSFRDPGVTTSGGFAAYGGDRTVNIGGDGQELTFNSGQFVISNIVFGATDSDGTVNFENDLNLSNGTRTFEVVDSLAEVEVSLNGAITGTASGALEKTGGGTLRLAAVNTYTNTTTINSGTLLVDGSTSASSTVTANSGGALGGIGTVGGAVVIADGGTLTRRLSGEVLTIDNSLTLQENSTYYYGGMTGEEQVHVDINGTLDLSNAWTLALGSGLRDGGSTTLFTYDILVPGADLNPAFDLTDLGFTPTETLFLTDTGTSIVLNGVSLIPEPSALGLLPLGVGILALRRTRRA